MAIRLNNTLSPMSLPLTAGSRRVTCTNHTQVPVITGGLSVAAKALIITINVVLNLVEVQGELVALGADEDGSVVAGDAVALHQLTHSTLPELVSH